MLDPELVAMDQVKDVLEGLHPSGRLRLLRWIVNKFEIPLTELRLHDPAEGTGSSQTVRTQESERFDVSLSRHIKSKRADRNQIRRFLVTADWLRRRGLPLSSTAVAKALAENQQSRLANPADCLNKNVAKGLCEKTKDGFYVTPEGLAELGYP